MKVYEGHFNLCYDEGIYTRIRARIVLTTNSKWRLYINDGGVHKIIWFKKEYNTFQAAEYQLRNYRSRVKRWLTILDPLNDAPKYHRWELWFKNVRHYKDVAELCEIYEEMNLQ